MRALVTSISKASGLSETEVKALLAPPKQREHGDLALPCFVLAKSQKISPVQCAKELAAKLVLPSAISKLEVAGPYINFHFERSAVVSAVVSEILIQGEKYGSHASRSESVIVEYSSPNIAKTFHVGHLRTTLIGHSLHQIYKHLGYNTIGINHLGDWGTQFGFVYAGCKLWGQPSEPSVDSLVELYRRASALRKAQDESKLAPEDIDKPNVNQMARDYFIKLESGDPEAIKFWQWCLDVSMQYLLKMYERMGINFDYHTGESFYRDMIPAVEQRIKDSGILVESEGALGVELSKELGFARIFAADGRSLYITRDIATALYRFDTFAPHKILYVVAAQQALHFKQLIAILANMKHPVAERMQHVAFGFVPGMSTREGGGISLKQFLDEANSRALNAYLNEVTKRPEGVDPEKVAEKVAIGAMYFYFLSQSNVKDLHFKWEQALNFNGDSGPYLQYAVARINSIESKAREFSIVFNAVENSSDSAISLLVDDSAYALVSLLSEFKDVVQKAAYDYEPYYIAQHLLEIAKAFSRAYNEHKVVGAEAKLAQARLQLFVATRTVLSIGMKLLGVPVIERM